MENTKKTDACSVFDLLDGPLVYSSEEEWDCPSAYELIAEANRMFSLADYLDKKYSTQTFLSDAGWTRRMICPFHKMGHERTSSFFINSKKNIFYCQACGISGGFVQFLAALKCRPKEWIAEHIIRLAKDGGTVLAEIDHAKRLEEKKKITKALFQISDLFRVFIVNHSDDDLALKYADKLMSGFDNIRNLDKEEVESNIEEFYNNFKTYLLTYDRKNT